MAASGLSGNQGKVLIGSCTIAQVEKWDMDFEQGIDTFVAQSSAPWQQTVQGNKKVSGTVSGAFDNNDPIDTQVNTQNLVTLLLYHSTGHWYSLQVRVGKVSFGVDINAGTRQTWSFTFESHGPMTII